LSLSNALRLYRVRLRARLVQECFALVGIAAGVALLFAAQISSTSLESSVSSLSRGVLGNATLQLLARDPHGFPESILTRIRGTPGVLVAAPLLEASAQASGPRGSEAVELVGAGPSVSELHGTLLRHLDLEPFGSIGAVVLPASLAHTVGVTKFGREVTFQLAGRTVQAPLYEALSQRQIGPLASSPVAVAPLAYVQEMTGLTRRVSRILVQPAPGSEPRVRAALRRIAAGRLNVEPAEYDESLFAKAAAAVNQSTTIFALISALVGFLFAFNAMLLTVPQRRRLVLDLRRDGYRARTVAGVLLLDAAILGAVACLLGLALGDELSIHVLHSDPAFLSLAFALGTQRVVSLQSVAFAATGGMLAAIVAVLSPLRSLTGDPVGATAPPQRNRGAGHDGRAALVGVTCLVGANVMLLAFSDAAVPAMVLLLAALLLILPFALSVAIALLKAIARVLTGVAPHVATMELSVDRSRAIAVTATGALAVFGSVALQGAHGDLLKGLESAAAETSASTDVWVAPAGSYDLLDTTPFPPRQQSALQALPGVRAVRLYRSGFLDWGQRRVLVIAPPRQASPLLPAGQLVAGNPQRASERVRAGGWLVLSQALASEHDLRVGEAFTLPSPAPKRFRVAALSTNIGWVPGAVIMNAADYARAWESRETSAYSILLTPGFPPARAAREIQRALGPDSALGVETAAQHATSQAALSRQALGRLTQIATLILLVAVLAMASAVGGIVWQRRPRLAKLKLEGLSRATLWRTILLESLVLLGVGCTVGALFGLYGQQLADRALANTVNFPVVHSLAVAPAVLSLAIVSATALAILAIPGYLAAGVPAAVALQD
jgi:putative ABC transport system permease protein